MRLSLFLPKILDMWLDISYRGVYYSYINYCTK